MSQLHDGTEPTGTVPAAPAAPEPERLVVVAENGTRPYGQSVTAGPHVLTADEPAPLGSDTGPNPFDLLLSALGACTSMTVRMYADRKGWPLEHISVALRHERVAADEGGTHRLVDHITRDITFEGPLDADQLRRLTDIANKCPVHRAITGDTRITTTVV